MPVVRADWKITTVTHAVDAEYVETAYYKGPLVRRDASRYRNHDIVVFDRTQSREVTWFPDLGQYIVVRYPRNSVPQITDSWFHGKCVDLDARGTGETKVVFGRQVRHFIAHRQCLDADAQTDISFDVWYVAMDNPPEIRRIQPVYVLGAKHNRPGWYDQVVPMPQGILVSQTIESVYKSHAVSGEVRIETEVTELTEAVLPVEAFEPPPRFVRILKMPGDASGNWVTNVRARAYDLADRILSALGR